MTQVWSDEEIRDLADSAYKRAHPHSGSVAGPQAADGHPSLDCHSVASPRGVLPHAPLFLSSLPSVILFRP